ncbi:MAG TPA: tRNA (adenosine(37)-N6)-threonylcarbamoyltransferase complex ATPase subunit type 1 TsaE [Puia sp.]|nr:tRNA (adenosine(37)-N6)-threonylcarbamoyltransferase complex ATPase subunit type 1 TsaE [Puia sp.]
MPGADSVEHSRRVYICSMELEFSLNGIGEAAQQFWANAGNKKVFAFYGEMGSGKTTFIKALCEQKRVEDHVTSPTFSLINEYAYPGGRMFHIDLFRLKDEEEAIQAGVEDCLYSGAICFIEWAEKVEILLPDDAIRVRILSTGDHSRKITMDRPNS